MADLSACLLACQSPDPATRQAAEQTLARGEAENFVGLLGGLAAELAGEDRPPNSRQLAGLQLKNLLSARSADAQARKEERWTATDGAARAQIKAMLVACLRSGVAQAAHTAAQCVARVGAVELPAAQWPELLPALQGYVRDADAADGCKVASLNAIGFLCDALDEDAPSRRDGRRS